MQQNRWLNRQCDLLQTGLNYRASEHAKPDNDTLLSYSLYLPTAMKRSKELRRMKLDLSKAIYFTNERKSHWGPTL